MAQTASALELQLDPAESPASSPLYNNVGPPLQLLVAGDWNGNQYPVPTWIMSKSECTPATSSHEPLACTQLHLIMHENLDHSITATETFGNPSGYNYASSSCNSRAICDRPQSRSIDGRQFDALRNQRSGTGRATYCNAGDILSESTTRGDFSQHFLHPRTREDDRGALISVQLSTTVSAAAIHTSSCTAVVDEHHTGAAPGWEDAAPPQTGGDRRRGQ